MKKFLLLIFLIFISLPFLSAKTNAQPEPECRKIFDSAMSQCTKDYNACSDACSKKTKKPDGTTYFNSGEIYTKCMKASDCSGKSSACSEQALANFRACGKPGEQPKAAEVKKETPKQEENPVVHTITNWVTESDIITDCRTVPVKGCLRFNVPPQIPVEFKTITGKNLEETLNWQPIITKEAEQKAWREFLPIYTPGKENIAVVSGQGEIKPPNSAQFEFITVTNTSAASDMVTVTFFDSTVKSTSDAVQLRYAWSPDSGAVINVPNLSEIKFREPVEVGGFTSRRVELGQGEIEVKIRN
ncbi:hypothetical protein HYW41_05380, partial [Candidatus Daviesbacteria bacterium]|nr:hypothetical protein [Candidatus Daviesbacteria bacterium]